MNKMTGHILSIGCLLIDLGAHMFSQNGFGSGTKAQGAVGQDLGDPAPWAFRIGHGPISMMAEHVHQGQSIGTGQSIGSIQSDNI